MVVQKKVEAIVSDGMVNGIGMVVWSVEKNAAVCLFPLPRRNGCDAEKSGILPHRIDVG